MAVTIVVPVYADWPSLKVCIDSIKNQLDTRLHKVLLVNDCGPEADSLEKKIQVAIKGLPNFYYFRNQKNLGYVGTCNRAVEELDKSSNDVLILTSDTEATEGFLDEMTAVLNSDPKIGTVSPRSNNATLATVPLWAAQQKGINAKDSYAVYQKIKSRLPSYYEVPTAHGFCMLVRRSLIKKYGLFDEAFGKGYGEEVDFCRRIKKRGFKNTLANRAYVFHLEARSFGLETKAKLIEQHNKIIWERYPEYRQEVRDYMSLTVDRERKIEESVGLGGPSRGKLYRAARRIKKYLTS